jgi:hypothetical protein
MNSIHVERLAEGTENPPRNEGMRIGFVPRTDIGRAGRLGTSNKATTPALKMW